MKLYYNVSDKPPFSKVLVFAFQQLLAILSATILVPSIINTNKDVVAHFNEILGITNFAGVGMSQSVALFGAGVGTLVYLLFTKFKSPVFLGSSFAFLGSMAAAFIGAVSVNVGYLGLVIGAALAGLVYVVIAIISKYVGTDWIFKLMPKVVIGPTVAIIGLSLSASAITNLKTGPNGTWGLAVVCGLITLIVTIVCSVFGKKTLKMIPFIIGIGAGYLVATFFTLIGKATDNANLMLINFETFKDMQWVPSFSFVKAFGCFGDFGEGNSFLAYFATIAAAYVPVAFVVFAEHVADHRNLGNIINAHLLRKEPGLCRTLLGDGVGSIAGAFFGGCPNTTYGESVACVAISGNASVITTIVTAFMAIVFSFIAPFVTFLATIPNCVMGGVCIALYGFIAVSGLKMIQKVDLEDNKNLFVVSTILVCGIGGFAMDLTFGSVVLPLTEIAVALILGIIVNVICNIGNKNKVAEKTELESDVDESLAEENK